MKKSTILWAIIIALASSLIVANYGEKVAQAEKQEVTKTVLLQGDAPAPGDADAAGFEEFPIGEELDFEPYIHVAGVYFQPVDLYPANLGLTKDKSNMHIEADISALEGNDLGFGAGDWVPFLTVDYEIAEKATGKVVLNGTFMPMSASDGPHYGANILLKDAGTYTVKFIIKDPSTNGYVLHVDKATGVPRHNWWPKPIVAQWDFDYTPNPEW